MRAFRYRLDVALAVHREVVNPVNFAGSAAERADDFSGFSYTNFISLSSAPATGSTGIVPMHCFQPVAIKG